MSIDIKNSSRLRFADLLSIDGMEFWDTLMLPLPESSQDDVTHIVMQGDRIDLIADRYYQDSGLWWVIAWANNLEILPTDMKENMRLRIPSKNYVISELLRKAARRA